MLFFYYYSVNDISAQFESISSKTETANDCYYDTYAHHAVHEIMLQDSVRMNTYRSAMCENRHLFEGKTVLDIGSGTGILSLFAAEAGAARVIGIEFTTMVKHARDILVTNNMSNIEFIQGKVEEVVLPVKQVDIIVCDVMGYCLYNESMWDTVLFARDKWLCEGGLMFPDRFELYIAAIEHEKAKKTKINWWESVYGFDMTVMRTAAISEPLIEVINSKKVISNAARIRVIDMYTLTKDLLEFTTPFELIMQRDDTAHSLVTWFTAEFTKCQTPHIINTAPGSPYTHWEQTVFYMDNCILVKTDERLTGTFGVKRHSRYFRNVDFQINFKFDGSLCELQEENRYYMR